MAMNLVVLKYSCALQLRAEQRRVVEKHGAGYGRAAMGAMRYADALAREVLRIWGPADVLFRYGPSLELPEKKFLPVRSLAASSHLGCA